MWDGRPAWALALLLPLLTAGAGAQGRVPAPGWFLERAVWWENREFNREFIYPLDLPIDVTSDFGKRKLYGRNFHSGLDLTAPVGSLVHPVYPGIVIATTETAKIDPKTGRIRVRFPRELDWIEDNLAGFQRACGKFVIQGLFPVWTGRPAQPGVWNVDDFDWGGFVIYCHLSEIDPGIAARRWTIVGIPSTLGYSGETGQATGPHLHIALYLNPRLRLGLLPGRLQGTLRGCKESNRVVGTCLLDPEAFITPRPRDLR
jgi:murein DD-endopeptidase MepM/ murein hydrolase activator NlpD